MVVKKLFNYILFVVKLVLNKKVFLKNRRKSGSSKVSIKSSRSSKKLLESIQQKFSTNEKMH